MYAIGAIAEGESECEGKHECHVCHQELQCGNVKYSNCATMFGVSCLFVHFGHDSNLERNVSKCHSIADYALSIESLANMVYHIVVFTSDCICKWLPQYIKIISLSPKRFKCMDAHASCPRHLTKVSA